MDKLLAPIPEPAAVTYARNWRDFNAKNTVNGFKLNEILPNAFTFDLSDITDILGESPDKVRVYFGYTSDNPTPSPVEPMPMKVMLVGVDAAGKDMIYYESPVSGIYDFATPCPSTCDFSSPLCVDPTPPTPPL